MQSGKNTKTSFPSWRARTRVKARTTDKSRKTEGKTARNRARDEQHGKLHNDRVVKRKKRKGGNVKYRGEWGSQQSVQKEHEVRRGDSGWEQGSGKKRRKERRRGERVG